jgi:hypothetical protein
MSRSPSRDTDGHLGAEQRGHRCDHVGGRLDTGGVREPGLRVLNACRAGTPATHTLAWVFGALVSDLTLTMLTHEFGGERLSALW